MEPPVFHEDRGSEKAKEKTRAPSLWGATLGWGAGLGGVSRSSLSGECWSCVTSFYHGVPWRGPAAGSRQGQGGAG